MNDGHIIDEKDKQDAPQAIELVIRLEPDSKLTIHGPIGNKALCYGLLEMAKDIVRGFKSNKSSLTDLIVPGAPIDPSQFKGRIG